MLDVSPPLAPSNGIIIIIMVVVAEPVSAVTFTCELRLLMLD